MHRPVITLERDTDLQLNLRCEVMLYNCDCHTFAEVAERLVAAISCSSETAWQYAQLVHTLGSASVYKGPRDECERVAAIIGATGIVVLVL